MENKLYPLIFNTQFKDKIWGGEKIKTFLGKDFSPLPNCGETWEISGVKGNVSTVRDGELAGKKLDELIQEHKGNLVGSFVYQHFGNEFPLLVKYIDANDDLSIQVHPDDELAMSRHQCKGKTEMWYILHADEGAVLNTGFNSDIDKDIYLEKLNSKQLNDILNFENVQKGDVYFLPAGRVHYIGKGICLAEIQQTSDITYRIYDFDRTDDKGNKRELHTDWAVDALDFKKREHYKTSYTQQANQANPLVKCDFFETRLINLVNGSVEITNPSKQSFRIYIGVEGESTLIVDDKKYVIKTGDAYLMPAAIEKYEIATTNHSKILESYIPTT